MKEYTNIIKIFLETKMEKKNQVHAKACEMQQEWYALEVQTHQSHKGKIEIAPIDNLHFKAENQEQSKPKMMINNQIRQKE